ncbi:protease inhibitor I42 family protein, partial [Mesorhizobium opportunistum]
IGAPPVATKEEAMANERATMNFQPAIGEQIVVELPATPGAGVVWSVPPAPAGCTITQIESKPDNTGIGGTTLQRFTVSCGKPGQIQLRFELKRPWEDIVRAVQPVTIDVK